MISNLYDDARSAFAGGASDAAANLCAQWLDAQPNDIDGLFLLALIRDKQQQHDAALALYDRILGLGVKAHEVWLNRSNTLCYLDRYAEALQSLDQALALQPKQAGLHINRGNILLNLDQTDAAIASYGDAIARDPASVDAHKYRGKARDLAGDLNGAIEDLDKAMRLAAPRPDSYAFRELCFLALRACDWPRVDWCREMMLRDNHIDWVEPFALCGYDVGQDVRWRCAAASARFYRLQDIQLLPQRRISLSGGRKLRIGYVSSDFFSHAVAEQLVNLIETHDRDRFEIFGFSLGSGMARARAQDARLSSIDRRMLQAFDHLIDLAPMDDAGAAQKIHDLHIDIALDVNGYTKGARPGILARRPAPVQVNYLGFPGTMAATHLDYLVADQIVLPFGDAPFFAEKIVQLDGCYQPNDRQRPIAPTPPERADLGLPDKGFVYCCFNNSFKIAAPMFASWMNILRAVPGSILWLATNQEVTRSHLRLAAAAQGVAPERLIFAPHVPLDQHIGRMRRADLYLDTLPYNSHTTGCESLWAGLPMLTCSGNSFAGRVGASILTAAGLPELIGASLQDYERRAIAIGRDPALPGS